MRIPMLITLAGKRKIILDKGDVCDCVEWRAAFYRAFPNNNPPAGQGR